MKNEIARMTILTLKDGSGIVGDNRVKMGIKNPQRPDKQAGL